VWGSGPSDVWAIGAGNFHHWNGTTWSLAVPTNVPAPLLPDRAVWGSGPSDAWVVGLDGQAIHWNGTAWSSVVGVYSRVLGGVWGSGSSDVWAVGTTIEHWDGKTWSLQDSGAFPLAAVWGSGPTNVWAVGMEGVIVHSLGGSWSSTASGTIVTLNGVSGSGADDVWAVGNSGTILHH
jgi:hypothetical protein